MQYLIQDSTLSDIASAIREKIGSSDPIGVGGFAEAIRNISGMSSLPVLIDCGMFILSSDASEHIVNHQLGQIPDIICVWVDKNDVVSKENSTFTGSSLITVHGIPFLNTGLRWYNNADGFSSNRDTILEITANSFKVRSGYDQHVLKAGARYKWVAIYDRIGE